MALFDGRAELAVHSLKDVPMDLPEGFDLAAVMTRADARDAFVSTRYASLDELPPDAVVGTSSLRRAAQLQARHPGFRIQPLRGNLDTRLGKLDAGQYDAIVLAAAGLTVWGWRTAFASTCRWTRCCRHRGRACWVSRSGPIVTMCARPWPS